MGQLASTSLYAMCTKSLQRISIKSIPEVPQYYTVKLLYNRDTSLSDELSGIQKLQALAKHAKADENFITVEYSAKFNSHRNIHDYVKQLTQKGACLSCLHTDNCCVNNQNMQYMTENIPFDINGKVQQISNEKTNPQLEYYANRPGRLP